MKKYELTVIIPGSLDDKQAVEQLAKVRDIVVKRADAIVSENNWGRRLLAYPIVKQTYGTYGTFEFTADGEGVVAMERDLQLGNLVIRYLTTEAYDAPVALVEHAAKPAADDTTKSAEEILRRSSQTAPAKTRRASTKPVAEEVDEDIRQKQLDEALGKILTDDTPAEPTTETPTNE